MHIYSQEEKEFIKEIAYGHSWREIRDMFNEKFGLSVSEYSIKGMLTRNKIRTGNTGKFPKGHIPHNKGTHIGGYEPTQFKKGHIPQNHKNVGTEILRADGYVWIKVAEPNKWRQKHVVIWEEANGKVKEGNVVIFLDGNRGNISLDNLAEVSRKVALQINRLMIKKTDKELTKQMINVAKIQVKISEVIKNGSK